MIPTIERSSLAWAKGVIGIPYEVGASGPSSFDCWGLVREFHRSQLGIVLDVGAVDIESFRECAGVIANQSKAEAWQSLETPSDGCVVAMGRGKHLHHVGVWLSSGAGSCIHAMNGAHVISSSMRQLGNLGFTKIRFFKHV